MGHDDAPLSASGEPLEIRTPWSHASSGATSSRHGGTTTEVAAADDSEDGAIRSFVRRLAGTVSAL